MHRIDPDPTISTPVPDLALLRERISIRRRIELHGFRGVPDDDLASVDRAARLAPTIGLLWTVLGVATSSSTTLYLLLPFTALGSLLPRHPFDLAYEIGIRPLVRGPHLPSQGSCRRIEWAFLSLLGLAVATSFDRGAVAEGVVMGSILVAVASVPVTTGFGLASLACRRVKRSLRRHQGAP